MRRQRKRRKRRAGRVACASFLTLHVLLLAATFAECIATRDTHQLAYYTRLTRLGLIAGARVSVESDGDAQQVAAFLGVPYAAPPTGLLRFMPPAATGAQVSAATIVTRRLAPENQRASVRAHAKLGARCPRLEPHVEQSKILTNGSDNKHAPQTIAEQQHEQEEEEELRESEDCLNLNVFVPIHKPHNKTAHASRQSSDKLAAHTHQAAAAAQAVEHPPIVEALAGRTAHSALPVIIVIQQQQQLQRPGGQVERAAQLAARTNCVLVTLNYRTGLLGFLPYADTSLDGDDDDEDDSDGNAQSTVDTVQDDNNDNALANNQTDDNNTRSDISTRMHSVAARDTNADAAAAAAALRRQNHAIYDLLGALHFVQRHAAAFQGDASRVTLLALDAEGALLAQLLALTPLAKHLFARLVLTSSPRADAALSELIVGARAARPVRRRLHATLARAVASLHIGNTTTTATTTSRHKVSSPLERVRAAPVQELKQLLVELRRSGDAHELALATRPTLDDAHLFPQLRALAAAARRFPAAAASSALWQLALANATLARAEFAYCAYLRRALSTDAKQDPLKLVSTKPLANSQQSGWRRSANVSRSSNARKRRTMAAASFAHVSNIDSLHDIIASATGSDLVVDDQPDTAASLADLLNVSNEDDANDDDDDEEDEAATRRQGHALAAAARADARQRRNAPPFGDVDAPRRKLSNELAQIIELLGTCDLMLIYDSTQASTNASRDTSGSQLVDALAEMSPQLEPSLLNALRLAELHELASVLSDASLDKFCDISAFQPDAQQKVPHNKARTTHVLINDGSGPQPLDDLVAQVVGKFAKNGNPNDDHAARNLPSFDTLDRRTLHWPSNKTHENSASLKLHLDVAPYLAALRSGALNSPSEPLMSSLNSCVSDLTSTVVSSAGIIHDHTNLSSSLRCLRSCLHRFRVQLRHLSADTFGSFVALDEASQTAQVVQREERRHSPASNIATRNLLNGSSTSDTTGGEYVVPATSPANVIPHSQSSAPRSNSGGFGGFLASAYKDAMGKALTIVFGTVLFIFLLNFVIVFFGAMRSARKSKRCQVHDNQNGAAQTQMLDAAALDPEQHCDQQVRKSNLKHPIANGYVAHQLDQMQLTSNSSVYTQSASTTKQLKFDLTGVEQAGEYCRDEEDDDGGFARQRGYVIATAELPYISAAQYATAQTPYEHQLVHGAFDASGHFELVDMHHLDLTPQTSDSCGGHAHHHHHHHAHHCDQIAYETGTDANTNHSLLTHALDNCDIHSAQ